MKLALSLLFISSLCYGDCKIDDVLPILRPGETWVINNKNYDELVWLSKTNKPTRGEVNAAIGNCVAQEAAKKAEKDQAILDAKDTTKADAARLDALIKAIDLK